MPGVFNVVGIDFVTDAGIGLGHGAAWLVNPGLPCGSWGRSGRLFSGWGWVLPEAAVFEDAADEIALAGFDEGDDLHGAAALGTQQRVGLVNALD